jgi:hypothetical protein
MSGDTGEALELQPSSERIFDRELHAEYRRVIPHYVDSQRQWEYQYRLLPPKRAAGVVDAAPRPVPTVVFEPFLRLPFDIRAQIWECALPGPRLVTVFAYKDIMFGEYIAVKRGYRSPTRPPTILFVSRESRDIALRHYQLCFGVGRLERWLPSTIYFNFKLDTLYFEFDSACFGNSEAGHFITSQLDKMLGHVRLEMDKVERVAVSHRSGMWAADTMWLSGFVRVKEVIIGIEREIPPVSNYSVLEEPEGQDSDLAPMYEVLSRRSNIWKEDLSGEVAKAFGGNCPVLKLMEVRSRNLL